MRTSRRGTWRSHEDTRRPKDDPMINLCWASVGDGFLLSVSHVAMRGPQFPPLDELQRGIQRAKSCVHGISAIISSQKTLQKEQHRWLVHTTHSDFAMKTLNSVLYMLNQRFTTGGLKKLELESSQPSTIHLWHRWWRRRWWLFVLPGWPKRTPHWCAKMGHLNYKNAVKIGACTIN